MDVHPIRTDEEHAKALAEIERLRSADPATPGGRRLEILLTRVAAYEQARHPIPPDDPNWIDPDDAPDLSAPEWRMKFAKAPRDRSPVDDGPKTTADPHLNADAVGGVSGMRDPTLTPA